MTSDDNISNEDIKPPEPVPPEAPDAEVTPGQLLSRKREALGLSIQQVADELHITMHYVRALEADAHEKLPGVVFIRGYIRAYANYLKLDPTVLVNVFNEYINQRENSEQEASYTRSRRRRDRNLPWIAVSGVAFVLIAVALWYFGTGAATQTGSAATPAPAGALATASTTTAGAGSTTPSLANVATTRSTGVEIQPALLRRSDCACLGGCQSGRDWWVCKQCSAILCSTCHDAGGADSSSRAGRLCNRACACRYCHYASRHCDYKHYHDDGSVHTGRHGTRFSGDTAAEFHQRISSCGATRCHAIGNANSALRGSACTGRRHAAHQRRCRWPGRRGNRVLRRESGADRRWHCPTDLPRHPACGRSPPGQRHRALQCVAGRCLLGRTAFEWQENRVH
jgi:transcriptional regulator with XRE-family HTH domain